MRLNPTADSYVVSTSPTTNYGTNNQLTARTTSPVLESFLRFSLPAAPAGTTLTGASLRVRTSTDSTAATADATNFTVVDGAWEESTVNWNNRPTGTGVRVRHPRLGPGAQHRLHGQRLSRGPAAPRWPDQ